MNDSRALELLAQFNIEGMLFTPNTQFGIVDSGVLYNMVRLYNPQKMIEVGSGFSTSITAQVLKGYLICIDPDPRAPIQGVADIHIAKQVETLELDWFTDIDMLFIDSSHQVEAGDVPFLLNEVLPVLKSGCVIHFHDIFLPWDYNESWEPRHYTEQYALRDFLEANENYEVLWPGYWMFRTHAEKLLPVFGELSGSGSFWICKS